MATDSSSGTLPSSSRFTIDSSSSIARSKLSFLTSTWVFSAILLFPDAPFHRRRFKRIYAGVLWRVITRPPPPWPVPRAPPSRPAHLTPPPAARPHRPPLLYSPAL